MSEAVSLRAALNDLQVNILVGALDLGGDTAEVSEASVFAHIKEANKSMGATWATEALREMGFLEKTREGTVKLAPAGNRIAAEERRNRRRKQLSGHRLEASCWEYKIVLYDHLADNAEQGWEAVSAFLVGSDIKVLVRLHWEGGPPATGGDLAR